VGAGLVTSLARPGGNVTGLSGLAAELNTKRLEILKDAVPKLIRVGLLWPSGGSVATDLQLKELRAAAPPLKLKLEEIETQLDAKGLESAFQTAKQKQVNAIMTITTRRFFAERKRIVELAGKYRLPAIYFQKEFVDEGGLMSYGADYDDLFRRAAVYVDKILKGAKPADLPVQQATKFEFVINLKAAKQIGLTLSPEFLSHYNPRAEVQLKSSRYISEVCHNPLHAGNLAGLIAFSCSRQVEPNCGVGLLTKLDYHLQTRSVR
jgi:putative ABC transport system substrate-binding protein